MTNAVLPRALLNATFGVLALLAAAANSADVREETVRIEGPVKGLKLGLRHAVKEPAGDRGPIVLILQGAAVPVSGNPGYRFGGRSLITALAESGLDVWALDYYGFGESDRYPQMAEPADKHPPLGRAEECADQVDATFAFLQRDHGIAQITLIGDSGGSLVAGVFAARRPQLVSRLVLFGPVTPFTAGPSPQTVIPAYSFITPREVWSAFSNWADAVEPPAVLDGGTYDAWAETYLRSDPTSRTRAPPSVQIPSGRQADLAAIATGRFTYDPSQIRAPTLIVIGAWDMVATFPGAEWLLKSLRQARERRLVVIGHGSHTIQYEAERGQLYRVLTDFLHESG